MDQAIAAVDIADDLLEQYFSILQQLEDPSAGSGIVAGAASADQFSLHIAEANRVFEGVWDQLDHARESLSSRGVDIPDYDELRATQRAGLGIVDSSQESRVELAGLALGKLVMTTELAAEANLQGALAAQQASDLLKGYLPDGDWEAKAAARLAIIEAREQRAKRNRRIFYGVVVAGFAVIAFWVISALVTAN